MYSTIRKLGRQHQGEQYMLHDVHREEIYPCQKISYSHLDRTEVAIRTSTKLNGVQKGERVVIQRVSIVVLF